MKSMYKKILFISMWVILVSGLIVTLGFAEKQEARMPCKELKINIGADSDNYFIDNDDIKQMLYAKGDSIIGETVSEINVNAIEKLIYTNPWVKKADAYLSLDGVLQMDIEVRKPLVRIINENGENFYLDTEGKLMLWSQKYTPRILVANGNIHESFGVWYKTSVNDISVGDQNA